MGQVKKIVGIDEVGRGAWAGPLVAAAVILDKPIDGLKDSKLLSKTKREKLAKQIYENAIGVGIGWCDVEEINANGLTSAVAVAMTNALNKINVNYDEIIIDGNFNFLKKFKNVKLITGADRLVSSVSAASIVAKVYRDKWMGELSILYPEYGFDRHVGYGTGQHRDMIKQYGLCPLHRTFYKPIKAFI